MEDNFIIEQTPFGTDDFADNPEPRCPCLLLLDTSYSMSGKPIQELNSGVACLKEELEGDPLAVKRVEVAVITFGPVKVECDFHTAPHFSPPLFQADNNTPMGAAIERGIDLISERKEEYRRNGISFYRPWIFLITDGAPTDEWQRAAARIQEGEGRGSFAFFAVGVQNADMGILEQIAVRQPLKLKGLCFRELFMWLSNSMKTVSQSTPGEKLFLPPPSGWTEI